MSIINEKRVFLFVTIDLYWDARKLTPTRSSTTRVKCVSDIMVWYKLENYQTPDVTVVPLQARDFFREWVS